jgi:hypothetical protein
MIEERTEVVTSETYVIKKYLEEDYESGESPYEETTLVFEGGVLVSESTARKEGNNGTD